VSRLEGKVNAFCLELKEVHELLIAQWAPIKESDPCASRLKIQLSANFSPIPLEYNMIQELEPPLESTITSLELVWVRPLKCPPLQEIPTNTLVKRGLLKKARRKLVVAMVDRQQLAVEIGSPQWDNRTQVGLENDTQRLPKDDTQML
jgi:hypothetical protein